MFSKNRFEKVREKITAAAGRGNVRTDNCTLALHSYDSGLGRARPEAVIFVDSPDKIAPLVAILRDENIPFVARAAGTNLTGGCVPLKGGVILNLAGLGKILEVDTACNIAHVEPSVVNAVLQAELARAGRFFAPDPLSMGVSTIAGNIMENACGPRAFRYGCAAAALHGAQLVTPDGGTLDWSAEDAGPMLSRFLAGSEGVYGVASSLRVKILPQPAAVRAALAGFPGTENAVKAVHSLIADGILPRAAVAFDRVAVSAAEARLRSVAPLESDTALLLEFDADSAAAANSLMDKAQSACRAAGASEWIEDGEAVSRAQLWRRMDVYSALARMTPSILAEDMAVPPARLAQAVAAMRRIAADCDVRAALVYYPADGSLRPHIIFDERNSFESGKVKKAALEMLKCAVELGGTISGGRGVGIDKRVAMSWLYAPQALELFRRIKHALDPKRISNPDKILPVASGRHPDEQGIRPAPTPLTAAASALVEELKARARANRRSGVFCRKTRWYNDAGGAAPPLDVSPLNSIIEADARNRAILAEAGARVEEISRRAAEAGLRLRLPPYKGSIGGLLAGGAADGARELLLGMTFALADGTVISVGGKCVKDPPGCDVMSLLAGSRGAYGVILSVILRADGAFGAQTLRPQTDFKPSPYHYRLKHAFDPGNLLNPGIYPDRERHADAAAKA